MIAKQVEHHHVFLGLREHHAAVPTKPQLENAASMNLAHAEPGATVRLAERTWEFFHCVRQLLAKILRSAFELALKSARQRDSHARRRGLVRAVANLAGDSYTLAVPASNSMRASWAR